MTDVKLLIQRFENAVFHEAEGEYRELSDKSLERRSNAVSGARKALMDALSPRWQPINTAPRDRTPVVVGLIAEGKLWRVSDAAFNHIGWYTLTGGQSCHWATHWIPMPLPDPPQIMPMPRLDFICIKCGVQQHASGICANCGSGNLCAQPSDVKGMPAS